VTTLWRPGVIIQTEQLTAGIIEAIKVALKPEQTVALTAWAEARSRFDGRRWVSNSIDAMADIVNVISNRSKDPRWKAMGHKGVCLARRQFSCWDTLGGPANFYAVISEAQNLMASKLPENTLLNCLALAEVCVHSEMLDTLDTATHYYAPASMLPKGAVPKWIVPPAVLTAERHGHRFYKNVR